MVGKSGTILFLCTGNAIRSQMAEGFARAIFPPEWRIYSAGILASGVQPMTVEVMREAGIDISGQRSKRVNDVPVEEIDHLITLCGHARETCPNLPHVRYKEHWPIDDPMDTVSTPDERKVFRRTRDDIRPRVEGLREKLAGGDA